MTHSIPALTLTHECIRRTYRVGACPVLEVSISYPCFFPDPDYEGELPRNVTRFNQAYRAMAENLAAWGDTTLREIAEADFSAAGSGAAYCFDRRLMSCLMEAVWEEDERAALTVTRSLRLCSRRGTILPRELTAADRWLWPSLTLLERRERERSGRGDGGPPIGVNGKILP